MACRPIAFLAFAVAAGLLVPTARAEDPDLQSQVIELRQVVASQQKLLLQQQKELEAIRRLLLQGRTLFAKATDRPGAAAVGTTGQVASLPPQASQDTQSRVSAPSIAGANYAQAQPQAPVGQPPPEQEKQRPEVQAISGVGGVLTPQGVLTLEPGFEYDNAQVNKFFFVGTEIVNAVFIGALEANNARQNTLVASLNGRYGITDRLEANVRVPYVYRSDRVATGPANSTLNTSLHGHDIGDVEGGLHYQINQPESGDPYYVANIKFKSNTGTNPFQVPYTSLGSQKRLPTGTGAWAVEPSLTVLFPSDPVVFYGNLGYAHNFAYDPNTTIPPNQKFTSVQPGDVLRGAFGLGFGINEKVTMSLGYEHDWVQSTASVINRKKVLSEELQIGSFNIGASYALSPRTSINANVVIGTTRDAPDARILVTVPISFGIAN